MFGSEREWFVYLPLYFIINIWHFKWDLWAHLQTGGCRRREVPWMHLQWPPLCPRPEDSLFSLRTRGHRFCPPYDGLIMNCFFLSPTGWSILDQCLNFRTIYAGLGTNRNSVVIPARQASGIDSFESIPRLLKSYKYRLRVLPRIQFPNWLKASKYTVPVTSSLGQSATKYFHSLIGFDHIINISISCSTYLYQK